MQTIIRRLIFKLAMTLNVIASLSINSEAKNSISYGGIEYNLDDTTLLLDAEGIYDSPLAYKDAKEVFCKINEIGKDVRLLIAPSVYWVDDPDDPEVRTDKEGTPFAIKLKCDHFKMIGLTDNPENVVFAANRGQTQGAVGNFTLFEFTGNSLETENITFGNYCNIDLNYKRNPDLNRQRRKDAIVQAQIGICKSTDKLYAKNCQFLSRLNLCPFVGARRSLYENCYFESTDDALSGSAVYLDCQFLFCSSKPFYSTSETGAVFLNCDIKSLCKGEQFFTKVPGAVTVIDTRFSGSDDLKIGWTRDASDAKCYQHNVSLNGHPYTIDAQRPDIWVSLHGKTLMDAYIVECNGSRFYNLPNLLNGNDGWDPKDMNGKVAEAEKTLGRKLKGIPVAMRMKIDKSILRAQNDTATIESTPMLWGSYPADSSQKEVFISDNTLPIEKKFVVKTSLPSGLTGSQTITMKPFLKKAPEFKKKPKLEYDNKYRRFTVNYQLKGKGIDDCMIYWTRLVQEESSTRAIMVKKETCLKGGNHYTPVMGDYGSMIIAVVIPKYQDTKAGDMLISNAIEINDIEMIKEMPESNLFTDFTDVPITGNNIGHASAWNFDVYKPLDTSHVTNWKAVDGPGWYYGKGFDASVSEGLVQKVKGARMSYVPTRDVCDNMSADIVVEPAKSGGQGFGSATAQYMDICLKFDPISLDGYALRIERTPDYDKAVRFSIVKYDKGMTGVVNKGVISNCYRTACSIHTEIKDGIMTATAYTTAAKQDTMEGVVEKVNISSPVEQSGLTGFCIQHTGSAGASSTLIKELKLHWD